MLRQYKIWLMLPVLLIVCCVATTTRAASLPSAEKTQAKIAGKLSLPLDKGAIVKLAQSAEGRRQLLRFIRMNNKGAFVPDLCQDCKNDCAFDTAVCIAVAIITECPPCGLICLAVEIHCLSNCGKPGHPCGPSQCR